MSTNKIDLPILLNATVDIAISAFEIIEKEKEITEFIDKSDASIVSEADVNAEQFIRDALQYLTPDIPVFGEELGCDGIDDASAYWLIDPIDGTAWYRLGVPIYGSLIALIIDGEPVLGTIGLPGLNQLCYAAKDQGCYFWNNGHIQQVHAVREHPTQLSEALVTASGIHGSSTWLENGDTPWRLLSLIEKAKLFKFAGDCIQHVGVIRGKVDAAVDTIMKPWDIAPLIICLRESGVHVSDLYGNTTDLLKSSSLLSSNNSKLASEIIDTICPRKGI